MTATSRTRAKVVLHAPCPLPGAQGAEVLDAAQAARAGPDPPPHPARPDPNLEAERDYGIIVQLSDQPPEHPERQERTERLAHSQPILFESQQPFRYEDIVAAGARNTVHPVDHTPESLDTLKDPGAEYTPASDEERRWWEREPPIDLVEDDLPEHTKVPLIGGKGKPRALHLVQRRFSTKLEGAGLIPTAYADAITNSPLPTRVFHWPKDIAADQPGKRLATGKLAQYLYVRDEYCLFPGCDRPARSCDIDHTIPWPEGDTTTNNLGCLDRYHHNLKTHWGWQLTQTSEGHFTAGHTRRPHLQNHLTQCTVRPHLCSISRERVGPAPHQTTINSHDEDKARTMKIHALVAGTLMLATALAGCGGSSGAKATSVIYTFAGGTENYTPTTAEMSDAASAVKARAKAAKITLSGVSFDGNRLMVATPTHIEETAAYSLVMGPEFSFRPVESYGAGDGDNQVSSEVDATPSVDPSVRGERAAANPSDGPTILAINTEAKSDEAWNRQATEDFKTLVCPASESDTDPAHVNRGLLGDQDPTTRQRHKVVACGDPPMQGRGAYLLDTAILTGSDVKTAAGVIDPTTGKWQVTLTLTGNGQKKWAAYTGANNCNGDNACTSPTGNPQFAIVLDGSVKSAPQIISKIDQADSLITGNFTKQSAKQLADVVKTATLGTGMPFRLVDTQTAQWP